jgi:two-component SAPR family response regulator
VNRHGDAYCLDLAGSALDVAEFGRQRRLAIHAEGLRDLPSSLRHWTAAVEIYVGDLLPEAGPSEWVVSERERLRLEAAGAAASAARLSRSLGRGTDAAQLAQRAIDLDPLRDTSWLLLAEIQESIGDVSSAALTRRQHARVRTELDIADDQRPIRVSPAVDPRPLVPGASRGPA